MYNVKKNIGNAPLVPPCATEAENRLLAILTGKVPKAIPATTTIPKDCIGCYAVIDTDCCDRIELIPCQQAIVDCRYHQGAEQPVLRATPAGAKQADRITCQDCPAAAQWQVKGKYGLFCFAKALFDGKTGKPTLCTDALPGCSYREQISNWLAETAPIIVTRETQAVGCSVPDDLDPEIQRILAAFPGSQVVEIKPIKKLTTRTS